MINYYFSKRSLMNELYILKSLNLINNEKNINHQLILDKKGLFSDFEKDTSYQLGYKLGLFDVTNLWKHYIISSRVSYQEEYSLIKYLHDVGVEVCYSPETGIYFSEMVDLPINLTENINDELFTIKKINRKFSIIPEDLTSKYFLSSKLFNNLEDLDKYLKRNNIINKLLNIFNNREYDLISGYRLGIYKGIENLERFPIGTLVSEEKNKKITNYLIRNNLVITVIHGIPIIRKNNELRPIYDEHEIRYEFNIIDRLIEHNVKKKEKPILTDQLSWILI